MEWLFNDVVCAGVSTLATPSIISGVRGQLQCLFCKNTFVILYGKKIVSSIFYFYYCFLVFSFDL